MHACGWWPLIKAAMISLFTGAVAAVNVMWAGPWSSRHRDEVLAGRPTGPGMAIWPEGRFSRPAMVTR